MHKLAQHVLGVQVFFAPAQVAWVWDMMPVLPTTARRVQCSSKTYKGSPAMLLPREGELFAIFVDERQGMFVQAQGCTDSLFVLQSRWNALKKVLPANSSCLAVVYENKSGKLVLGVYDVLRVGGVDGAASSTFERQEILFKLFQNTAGLECVERHWVGLEDALCRYIQSRGVLLSIPFEVDHLLRLLCDSPETPGSQYTLLLRPIATDNLGPA
jgi:hypothetical protein